MPISILHVSPDSAKLSQTQQVVVYLRADATHPWSMHSPNSISIRFVNRTSTGSQNTIRAQADRFVDVPLKYSHCLAYSFCSSVLKSAGWWSFQISAADEGELFGHGRFFLERADVLCAYNFAEDQIYRANDGVCYLPQMKDFISNSFASSQKKNIPWQALSGTEDGPLYISHTRCHGDEWEGFRSMEFYLQTEPMTPVVVVLKFMECSNIEPGIRCFDLFIDRHKINKTGPFDICTQVGHYTALDVAFLTASAGSAKIKVEIIPLRISYGKATACPLICAAAVFRAQNITEDTTLHTVVNSICSEYVPDLPIAAAQTQLGVVHRSTAPSDRVPSLAFLAAQSICSYVNTLDGISLDIKDLLTHHTDQTGKVIYGARGLCMSLVSLLKPDNDFTDNLLVNGSAELGSLEGWNIIHNGGDGWTVGDGFASAEKAFVTSFSICSRDQIIDLLAQGYPEHVLDASPEIYISETVQIGQCGGNNSKYSIEVKLLDANKAVLAENGHFTRRYVLDDSQIVVEHTFKGYSSGVRFVRFEDSAVDGKYWKGYYGPRMTLAKVYVRAEKGTRSSETSLHVPIKTALQRSIDLVLSESIPTAEEALDFPRASLETLRSVYEGDDECRFNLMSSWVRDGPLGFMQASDCYLSLKPSVQGDEHGAKIKINYIIGCFLNDTGMYHASVEHFGRMMAQLQDNQGSDEAPLEGNHVEYMTLDKVILSKLEYARALFMVGNTEMSLQEYQETLKLASFRGEPELIHRMVAAMNGMALCHLQENMTFFSPTAAGRLLRKALHLSNEVLQMGHIDIATIHQNLSRLYFVTGQLAAAEHHLLQSLSILQQRTVMNLVQTQRLYNAAVVLNNIAHIQSCRKTSETTVQLLLTARKVAVAIYGPTHPTSIMLSYNHVALLSKCIGRPDAEPFLNELAENYDAYLQACKEPVIQVSFKTQIEKLLGRI